MIPVSMDPPSILVSVNRSASLNQPLRDAGAFCVNILCAGQVALAEVFSSSVEGEKRFRVEAWDSLNGIPFLTDAQANLFCQLERQVSFGRAQAIDRQDVRSYGVVGPGRTRHRDPVAVCLLHCHSPSLVPPITDGFDAKPKTFRVEP
jgi:hypothetical protein